MRDRGEVVVAEAVGAQRVDEPREPGDAAERVRDRRAVEVRAEGDVLDADPARDVVDVQSIFGPIREKVVDAARRAGTEQTPRLSVLAEVGDEGGTFFFVRRR